MKLKLLVKFFFVLLLLSKTAVSQPWLKKLPQGKPTSELTLFDYQNAFTQYWEPFNVQKGVYYQNGVKKKAIGWKHFKRWEYKMENLVNPTTGEFPKKTSQQVYEEYLSTGPTDPTLQTANWTSLGTNTSTGGYSGIGRVACVDFHPTDVNTYWIGAGAGGLWVTTNNASSWTCLTDNNGVLAVSDIAVNADYATSNTIYIATGDKDAGDNNSIGVLKTTDAGVTWNLTGLTFPISAGNKISRLLMDPTNNQVVLAATTSGVYKTTDGGTTWSTQLTTDYFIDMEYKPGDFNTLYGSTKYGEIYVSTNGGANWLLAFSDSNAERIELGVSANQATWVYAIASGSDYGLYGVYKSTNSGGSYSIVFDSTTINLLGYEGDGTGVGGQGWYDLCIAVSPSDANTLFIGGVNNWRSTDGGLSWTLTSHWSGNGAQEVHADKHVLKFQNGTNLFEGNDGGIYKTTDNGVNWVDKSNGLVISQMYKLGVSQTVSTEVITGLQDNGTKLFTGGSWYDVKGGDGMECLIDYTDVNVQYGTYIYGQITRTTDQWSSTTDIEPAGAGEGAWVTPYIIDPVNSQTLYAGYADVWKTIDRGDNWTQISTMNTSDKIRSMAIAPSNNQVLYVADRTTMWKTIDGGTSWTDITGSLPITTGKLTSIAVKNNDPSTVWVSLSGYTTKNVFESVDGGATWVNISAGLPQLPAYSIVQNKQTTTSVQLYVGTEVGVYFKDGANNWVSYNSNLPNVCIGELEIFYDSNPANSKLRAATYGRALWETPVYTVTSSMSFVSSTTTQNNSSFAPPGLTDQEIISIEVATSGTLSPLNATSFTLNTAGSTNPVTDISNAKLYYTGNTNTFSNTTQFGTTINAPNGAFTVTGSQALSGGTNYFWLTYDVPTTATLGNILDAECPSFTVGSAQTPAVTTPAGSRPIGVLTYCPASAAQCDEHIANVSYGTVNNSSACTVGGYADYTSMSANIAQGGTLAITIINGNNTLPQDLCGVWVDWNNDGDFSNDVSIAVSGSPGVGPYSATISCPSGTPLGTKKIRVRIHYSDEATSACGNTTWGEVEDYLINVTTPPVSPVSGTAASSVTLCSGNSTTLTLSGYTGNIQWQQSPNGTSSWTIATSGNGATTAIYTTANLVTTTYYRASVILSGFPAVFSNVIAVTVNPTPNAIAAINGTLLTALPAGGTYEWLNCANVNTILTTAQTYTPLTNGTYAVVVTKSGCSDTSSCASITTIGIEEYKEQHQFAVYPSPATDAVTITVNPKLIGKEFLISDAAGKLVLSGKLTAEKTVVRVTELAFGVYIIKIAGHSKKLVK